MIALLYALVPSVSSAYWILSVMTTQVYLIVYLLMFVAAVNLRKRQPDVERGYTAPALKFLCVVGFLASAAAILIGFVPPSQFENGSDGGVRRADPGRHGAARPAAALAVPEVPQAQLEDGRRGGGVMSAAAPDPPSRQPHRTPATAPLYWIIGGVVVVLAIIGLITYSGKKDDRGGAAEGRSSSRRSSRQAGLRVPEDQDIIVRSLGSDGGAVCDNPANALGRATLARPDDQRRRLRRPPAGDRRLADPAWARR